MRRHLHRRRGYAVAMIAIIALGLWLRGRGLASTPPSGDEAESAINALTILQSGVPRGTYLGLPIYENCLTEPWPDHPEYEFRDSSYSSKDVAIYHGWLPLYAMAGSFKVFGVTADEPVDELYVRHDDQAIRTRVMAARLPSLIFSVAFMIVVFLMAREMFGRDAALAALLVVAVASPFVEMGREARYFSATLAISTACCWAVWRIYRHGRRRDYAIATALLALLFYTHLLAFTVACLVFVILLPLLLARHGNVLPRVALAAAAGAALTAPWLLWTGFLTQRTHIPPAREFLSFPADLIYYPVVRIPYLTIAVLGLAWLAAIVIFRGRLPQRLTRPVWRRRREIAFLLVWIVVGILAFTLLIPAASYFYKRMALAVMGPGVVWGAVLFAGAARSWSPRYAAAAAPVMFLAAALVADAVRQPLLGRRHETAAYDTVRRLRELHLDADTKLYCTPNEQLTLTFLTGMPFQSVAPVRKRYIDHYTGPVLLIEATPPYMPVPGEKLMQVAREAGHPIGDAEARRLAGPLSTWLQRQELHDRVAVVEPQLDDHPLVQPVVAFQRGATRRNLERSQRRGSNNPMVRGFPLRHQAEWWPIFFYRFVQPELRTGPHLNYAERIRSARAEVLHCGWTLHRCPPLILVQNTMSDQPSQRSAPQVGVVSTAR